MVWVNKPYLKRFKPLPAVNCKKPKPMEPLQLGETLFEDIKYPIHYVAGSGMEPEDLETAWAMPSPRTPTEEEVLKIYEDVSVLGDIERFLKIVYKPFYCYAMTESKFNLEELELLMDNARFERDKQMAVFVTRYSPICSLKIYPNGKVYCHAYSREGTRTGLIKIIRELREIGYAPRWRRLKFNVVNATFSVPFHLNLWQFHSQNKRDTKYDPLKLPFLTYKMVGTMVKMAIFPTGYVFVMFATTRGYTKLAIAHVLPILYGVKDEEQDHSEIELNMGDIDYKVIWEKFFQNEYDLSIDW
ncbi:TBP-related factor [Drosophila biarmipes]|uniref:TBP-related factor n=1 Tax=Drosophila biarmipes TaxID=125945 RepID=UPI0007E6D597|nr:TBP-related factor [Drosophila biarmipes]